MTRILILITRLVAVALMFHCAQRVFAQTEDGFAKVDREMAKIPASAAVTTSSIASYITARFSSEADRIRAVYYWITRNIRYDTDNMSGVAYYNNTGEIVDDVMNSRKGVCIHYSELFHDLAKKVGITSWVIPGYTMQDDIIDDISHAWCAARINSEWYLFDPTWGSGYVENGRFYPEPDEDYFMVPPLRMIRTHMPFDPMWQFLHYPLSSEEFIRKEFALDPDKIFFNYEDSLDHYKFMDEAERLLSSSRRIKNNGVTNPVISNWLKYIHLEIEYNDTKALVEIFNITADLYNQGVTKLNEFIDYRNRQFKPKIKGTELMAILSDAERYLLSAGEFLKRIKNPDRDIAKHVNRLSKSIDEAKKVLREQQAFLRE
jgi:hypothetical protein